MKVQDMTMTWHMLEKWSQSCHKDASRTAVILSPWLGGTPHGGNVLCTTLWRNNAEIAQTNVEQNLKHIPITFTLDKCMASAVIYQRLSSPKLIENLQLSWVGSEQLHAECYTGSVPIDCDVHACRGHKSAGSKPTTGACSKDRIALQNPCGRANCPSYGPPKPTWSHEEPCKGRTRTLYHCENMRAYEKLMRKQHTGTSS